MPGSPPISPLQARRPHQELLGDYRGLTATFTHSGHASDQINNMHRIKTNNAIGMAGHGEKEARTTYAQEYWTIILNIRIKVIYRSEKTLPLSTMLL